MARLARPADARPAPGAGAAGEAPPRPGHGARGGSRRDTHVPDRWRAPEGPGPAGAAGTSGHRPAPPPVPRDAAQQPRRRPRRRSGHRPYRQGTARRAGPSRPAASGYGAAAGAASRAAEHPAGPSSADGWPAPVLMRHSQPGSGGRSPHRSYSVIISSRRTCRTSPENGVARNTCVNAIASAAGASRAQAQHVGVVVQAGQPGRLLALDQRSPDPGDLVGGDLLAVTRAADHDRRRYPGRPPRRPRRA